MRRALSCVVSQTEHGVSDRQHTVEKIAFIFSTCTTLHGLH